MLTEAPCKGKWQIFLSTKNDDVRKAQAICGGCPIFDECKAHAYETRPAAGIWAGERWAIGLANYKGSTYGRPVGLRGRPPKNGAATVQKNR